MWETGTYDPATDTMYWGTGNPGPDWDAEYRPGDNLWTDSVLAMDPATGKVKWAFQYTPNDPFDYDEISEHPLVDVTINGKPEKLVVPVHQWRAIFRQAELDDRPRSGNRQAGQL